MDDEAILEQEALDEAEQEGESDQDRKARRQAVFAQRSQNGSEWQRKAANRYLRNAKNRRLLLGKGSQPKKSRIDKADYALLMAVAAIFDTASLLLNLIPYVGGLISGIVVTIPGTFTMYLLYKRRGIEFQSTKQIARFWGSSAIEMIPIINILPGFMLNVTLVSGLTKIEDMKKK